MKNFAMTGTVVKINKEQQITDSFKKREFVIEAQDGQYTNEFSFELHNERCDLIDRASEGDDINVSFNIRCRAWNEKYFTNLVCWKLEVIKENSFPEPLKVEQPKVEEVNDGSNDDLPF